MNGSPMFVGPNYEAQLLRLPNGKLWIPSYMVEPMYRAGILDAESFYRFLFNPRGLDPDTLEVRDIKSSN